MKDAEIFPVSFFSQAFDLIQKIQHDFHLLEADQVEMFSSQMKKHQALILSIHQQMRNIGDIAPSVLPVAVTAPPETERTAAPAASGEASGTGRTATGTVPGMSVAKISEEPVETLATGFSMVKRPVRSALSSHGSPSAGSETAKTTERSTITMPAMLREKPARRRDTAVSDTAERKKMIPAEDSRPPSVNDVIEKRILSDLRTAFSLNDHFRYRRELFRGNDDMMNKVISVLNSKESYDDSIRFLEEKLHWDFSHPAVKDFIKVLEIRFL
jgi:hypothetical protein